MAAKVAPYLVFLKPFIQVCFHNTFRLRRIISYTLS
jgi:hypothetical protein